MTATDVTSAFPAKHLPAVQVRDLPPPPRSVRHIIGEHFSYNNSGYSHAFIGDDGHGAAKFVHNGRALRRLDG